MSDLPTLEFKKEILDFKIECIKDSIKINKILLKTVFDLKMGTHTSYSIENKLDFKIHTEEVQLRNYEEMMSYVDGLLKEKSV